MIAMAPHFEREAPRNNAVRRIHQKIAHVLAWVGLSGNGDWPGTAEPPLLEDSSFSLHSELQAGAVNLLWQLLITRVRSAAIRVTL